MPEPDSRPLVGRHVAVLLGGLSSEREVSLVSGTACGFGACRACACTHEDREQCMEQGEGVGAHRGGFLFRMIRRGG